MPTKRSCHTVSPCRPNLLKRTEQGCNWLTAFRPAQAENLLVAEDGRIMLADFGATAKLEHARYSLPSVHLSDSSNSLSAASDGDSAVQSSGPSSEIRIEVGPCGPGHARVAMYTVFVIHHLLDCFVVKELSFYLGTASPRALLLA